MIDLRLSHHMRNNLLLSFFLGLIQSFIGTVGILFCILFIGSRLRNYLIMMEASNKYPTSTNDIMLLMTKNSFYISLAITLIFVLIVFIPCFLLGLYMCIYVLMVITKSNIHISAENIFWKYPGGEINTNWKNVKGISKQKTILPYLIDPIYIWLKEPVIPNKPILFGMYNPRINKIPIFQFVDNWETEPGKTILGYLH